MVAAALLILHGVQTWNLAQGAAPPLGGLLVGGDRHVALQDLRGRPVLVYFWSSGCPICRLMGGSVASLAERHQVLTVAIHSGAAEEVADDLQGAGISFPVLPDPEGEQARAWGLRGVPTSFVIDATGEVRFVAVGFTTEVGLRARLWAASL